MAAKGPAFDEPATTIEEGRAAYFVWDLPNELKQAIETAEPPSFTKRFDHEMDEEGV